MSPPGAQLTWLGLQFKWQQAEGINTWGSFTVHCAGQSPAGVTQLVIRRRELPTQLVALSEAQSVAQSVAQPVLQSSLSVSQLILYNRNHNHTGYLNRKIERKNRNILISLCYSSAI